MKIQNTKTYHLDRLKFLVYGAPGVGKTSLAGTIDGRVLLISAEAGTLCLAHKDIDVIDVTVDEKGNQVDKEHRIDRFGKIYQYLIQPEAREKYDWIFIDSLTEVSQNLLEMLMEQMSGEKDGFKMWGEYAKRARGLIKSFRDLPFYNVVFTALETEDRDENNRRLMRVDMQGKIGKQLPAFFDEVFWMHSDPETSVRMLTTKQTDREVAKDRSGKLDMNEPPDLGAIFKKISGNQPTNQTGGNK